MSSKALESFMKHVAPPTFSGKPHENVNKWLSRLQKYFAMSPTLSSAQKVCCAEYLLKDNAELWVTMRPQPSSEEQDPWEFFQAAIVYQYENVNEKRRARNSLYDLRQKTSVTNYITEFHNLHSKVPEITAYEAAQIFYHGLKPRIQGFFASDPSLLNDLRSTMRAAEGFDNSFFYHPQSNSGYQNRTYSRPPNPTPYNPMAMELDAMQQHRNPFPNSNRQNPGARKQADLNNRTCFYCHQSGHQAKSCPNKAGKARSQ